MRMFSECDTNAIIINTMLWEFSECDTNVYHKVYTMMRMFSECDTNAIIIKFILCYENVLWMWY